MSGGRMAWVSLAGVLAVAVGISGVWAWLASRRPASRGAADRPIRSLVAFRTAHRPIDKAAIARAASAALGREIGTEDASPGGWVAGVAPIFLLRLKPEGSSFLVNVVARPYVDDPEAAAAELTERRNAEAMRAHRAWVSVDCEVRPLAADSLADYRVIGSLLDALVGDDALLLYGPEHVTGVPWGPRVRQALRGEDPRVALDTRDEPPIFVFEDDDPRLRRAIAEARRRWPEFVAAFAARRAGQDFTVKVPIRRGAVTEHIWVDVTAVAGDRIQGTLGNDPVNLPGLRLGDPVGAAAAEVEDWAYLDGATPHGLFTAAAMASETHAAPRRP